MKHHGLVAIGCSAGGLPALQRLLPALGKDLDATIIVISHVRGVDSRLAEIIDRTAHLPAQFARDGEPIEPQRIVVAPPDRHLVIADDHFRLTRVPTENGFRPSIDVTFRSAACARTTEVIGVVLTGLLNDGTAGLRAIKRCGGITVVQDPDDADFPDMPRSALRHVQIDHCLPLDDMPALIRRLVAAPAGRPPPVPEDIRLECAIAQQRGASVEIENRLGKPSTFACPDCGGVLWEIEDGSLLRYRCHVGHGFTAAALASEQSSKLDAALNSALRAHREHAQLFRRLQERAESINGATTAKAYGERATEYEQQAEVILAFLERAASPPTDP